jgi:hypothetical protein
MAGPAIATKTQEFRPTSSCNTLPNHVLPLTRFGALLACAAAAWCNDHHNALLAREAGAPEQHDPNEGPACICWWLLKPVTSQAPPTAGTWEWAKEIFIINKLFNTIDKHTGVGTGVEFGGAGDLDRGSYLL